MPVTPYIFFDGRCEEAIDFYKRALGAKVDMLLRFSESPEPQQPDWLPPGSEKKVMHACLNIRGTAIMASDGSCGGNPEFKGMSLSLDTRDEDEADKVFAALSEGGQVQMPLEKTFFAKRFGMVADRFGVNWMIMAE